MATITRTRKGKFAPTRLDVAKLALLEDIAKAACNNDLTGATFDVGNAIEGLAAIVRKSSENIADTIGWVQDAIDRLLEDEDRLAKAFTVIGWSLNEGKKLSEAGKDPRGGKVR